MNDLILDGFVNSFAERKGISGMPTSEVFEYFVASSVLRKYHQSDITDLENGALVGGGCDGGMDMIAVLVNGHLVSTEDDVKFFVEKLRRLDVEFVFIQAKSSPRFRAADIGTFVFGVRQFFSAVFDPSTDVPFSIEIQQVVELARHIYSQTVKMQENPKCFLYFVTTGDWDNAADPNNRFADGQLQLKNLNIFSDVQRLAIGAPLLKKIYQDLERGVVKEVEFGKAAVFPKIAGVDQAYIGLLPATEFVELVSTDDGELNRELFYDNVRDFQGHNPVNREIDNTLADEQLRGSFPLLNNGVTIVARSINRTADTFRISDFQIVNGCQTTHILFQNKTNVDANMFVPVKLVATGDSQVITDVIRATNRQTAVLPEALESLSDFHKNLEEFYVVREDTRPVLDRVYYERRSKQYFLDKINPRNIVTLTAQIKSFVAMFLNEPHSHPRYYGELLKSYKERLFVDDHKAAPYYASGVSLLVIEKLLGFNIIDRKWRGYKHHLLMLIRMLISGYDMPKLNSDRITDYSLKVADTLRGEDGKTYIRRAVSILERSEKQFSGGSAPPHRLKAFTEKLIGDLYVEKQSKHRDTEPEVVLGKQEFGKLIWYNDAKYFGFIERDSGGSIFVHEGEIGEIPWHLRRPGTPVRYTVRPSPRRPGLFMATEVELRSVP